MSIGALATLVVFIEAFLHYFPWRLVLHRDLPRLAAYVLGVLGLMVPYTVWLIEHGRIESAWVLWMVIVAGGIAVGSLYGLDWIVDQVWRRSESEEREQRVVTELKERNRGQGKST